MSSGTMEFETTRIFERLAGLVIYSIWRMKRTKMGNLQQSILDIRMKIFLPTNTYRNPCPETNNAC